MAPGEKYVPLAYVAEKWNHPIDDLLEWAVQEEFQLFFSGEKGWQPLSSATIKSHGRHQRAMASFYQPPFKPSGPPWYEGLRLARDQISEMEKKFPELAGNQDKPTSKTEVAPPPPASNIAETPPDAPAPPAMSGEKPLIGRKAIASYLGVSESTIKNYMKKKGFPFFSQGGQRCAYPSKLNAWRQKKK
ncbi:MAG: hypothetical protein M0017_01350 [Desulfobacteraceae bacterium]|nr:hypothetical protein [Desulfobacteraceae bacterium]